jgi:hypothetical protein
MEAVGSSETVASNHHTSRGSNAENQELYVHRRENPQISHKE